MIAAQSLALGTLVGLIFGLARMPAPAPPTLAGVLGVVGISAGWSVAVWFLGRM